MSREHEVGLTPFHLAIPVRDVEEARAFYGEVLGCREGRSAETWVDFDLYGHQLVCHLDPRLAEGAPASEPTNAVDGHQVPIPHFGVVLDMARWRSLAQHLEDSGIEFLIEPYIRFEGAPGEQATLFFRDPSGNALEFKAFNDIEKQLFET